MMSFWQPRSVLQLVLLSFFVALAPLCAAILVTLQTLGELADKNREVTRVVLEVTRLGEGVQSDVLDLERRARQYLALTQPELAQLFGREREGLSEKLQMLQDSLPSQSPDVMGLLNSLTRLTLETQGTALPSAALGVQSVQVQRLDHEFSLIRQQSTAIKKWLLSSVDQLLEKNSEEADTLIDALVWLKPPVPSWCISCVRSLMGLLIQ